LSIVYADFFKNLLKFYIWTAIFDWIKKKKGE